MSRRKKHRHPENLERWMVSYADFITLMFALFVVLYSISSQDVEKAKKIENSIRKQFKMVAANVGGGAGDGNGSGLGTSLVGQLLPPLDVFPPRNAGPEEVQDYLERKIEHDVEPADRKENLGKLRHDNLGARITLAASAFFPSGSAALKVTSLKTLDKLAEILKAAPNKIVIEGHTDDIPIQNGQYPSNWELSSARATKIVRYLIERHKFDPKKLLALSYADQKPLVPNTSEENRTKNRRIEVLVVTDPNVDL